MPKKPEKNSSKTSEDVQLNFDFLKKFNFKYEYVFLLVFLILGFSMRYYHIDYPVVGYHNWKVAHYITEARNFAEEGFFKYGLFVPMRDSMEGIDEQPDGAHNDTFPTIAIIVGFFFKIFGQSLVVARTVNILFSLGAVVFFYLLIKELFNREKLALICAFLAAINPMYVFFSHNVDLINSGLFFMLAGFYYYVKWLKEQLDKNKFGLLYLSTGLIIFATITKYTFAVAIFPILLTFPYKKFLNIVKKNLKPLLITGAIASVFPLWVVYMELYVKKFIFGQNFTQSRLASLGLSKLIDFGILFDKEKGFWQIMESYVADNYTILGVILMSFGLIAFCFLLFNKIKHKYVELYRSAFLVGSLSYILLIIGKSLGLFFNSTPYFQLVFLYTVYFTLISLPLVIYFYVLKDSELIGQRFMSGYLLGVIFFFLIMGFKMSGHSYHQFPIAPLVLFMIAYFIDVVAQNVSDRLKNYSFVYLVVVLLILFVPLSAGKSLFANSMESKDRMFNTQFPGLDVAGEYMKLHKDTNDRMFHSSGQSFGVLWHADMPGYKPPASVEHFKKGEEVYNVSWVFVYQWGMQTYCILQPECDQVAQEKGDYLKDNYRLVQMGLMQKGQQVQPIYLLFRKGGSFNESDLNSMLTQGQLFKQTYELTTGKYEMLYVNLE